MPDEKRGYASLEQTEAVLKRLKGIAERHRGTHITTGIDRILSVVGQAYNA